MRLLKSFVRTCLPDRLEIYLQALNHYYMGEPELKLMKHVCDRQRPAVDVGANIGTYTYFLKRHASKVYCYEPNPMLADRLRKIFPDVDVRAKAVSDSAGTTELRIPVAEGRDMHELGSITQNFSDSRDIRSFDVAVVALDDEGLEDVGFVKIDVEQNEVAVLKGTLNTIKRCRPVIMTEVAPLLYPDGLVQTFQFIRELGYVGWFCFENQWRKFADFDPAIHANPEMLGKRFMNNNIFLVPEEVNGRKFLR